MTLYPFRTYKVMFVGTADVGADRIAEVVAMMEIAVEEISAEEIPVEMANIDRPEPPAA